MDHIQRGNDQLKLQNIIIEQALPPFFKKSIWHEISSIEPHIFLLQQQTILNVLLNDQELYNLHFSRFYENHLSIYKWWALSTQKYSEIKKYLFPDLLQRTLPDIKTQMLQNSIKRMKNAEQISQKSKKVSQFCMRSAQNSPKKVIVPEQPEYEMRRLKSILRESGDYSQDYHQLFMNTLDACDGSKYIHYDFQKHQRGFEGRSQYNKYIRSPKVSNSKGAKKQQITERFRSQIKLYRNQRQNNQTISLLGRRSVHDRIGDKQNVDKQNVNKHKSNYSNFEIMPIGFIGKRNQLLKRKKHTQIVLKKMPHIFGKRKPFKLHNIPSTPLV